MMTISAKSLKRFGALPLAILALLHPVYTAADDTEIYRAEAAEASTGRPKVLIVFDDSGSMGNEVDQQRPPYDPSGTYDSKFGTGRIYWSTDGSIPDVGSDDWFAESQNRCASSFTNLDANGVFQTTAARRWVESQTIPGDCRFTCPDGLVDRNGDQGQACYEETIVTEEQEVCSDNWRSATGFSEWLSYPSDRRRFSFSLGLEVSDPTCTTEEVEVSDYEYVQDRVQVCDEDSEVAGSWQALSSSVTSPPHVDCRNDAATSNSGNGTGIPVGYPQNNVSSGSEYGPTVDNTDELWGSDTYGFYTSHYLDWLNDESLEEPREKIEIARDVITSIIASNTGVDFGLMEFNRGFADGNINGHDGGRIVQRIIADMSDTDRENLITSVDAMTANGSTPLCESFYEAYRYISGQSLVYGNNASTTTYDPLAKDALAENSGTYISPNSDCAYTYIIIMTDGEPQLDDDATSRIESLTGKTCNFYDTADGSLGRDDYRKNCMPELAEYMANTDLDGDSSNGEQFGITYTIGFLTDQALLADTAEAGKGLYYTANNAQELSEAFQGALVEISSTDSTFTSPAVAVDTFTRTQSRDDIFYAMFTPGSRLDWPGNIKKLRLEEEDGEARLVDAGGEDAIDETTGFIKDTATTFWSASEDGSSVTKGGVGGRLALRDPSTRNIYIDTGANQALESFTLGNLDTGAFDVGTDEELWGLFGSSTQAGFEAQVAWAQGYDAYDIDGDTVTSEVRSWVLGDILHSQPLALNYGATTGFSLDDPDLRIVVGTNAGFVHMFGNSDGEEDWAFFPKELVELLSERRQNPLTSDNVYGMDLTPQSYRIDVDQDGTIEPADGDKVYLYLGMRRGGRMFYALDVSNPDSPSFMWSVDPSDTGFSELGQSWSRPALTFVPGYVDGSGNSKPVLVFGAGYDDRKDTAGVATGDTMGRGLFIVDAVTGALVWSVTPNPNSATNMEATELIHSVAADPTIVDSNGDGIADRVYFGDTGGNVWRVDMPGNALPDSAQEDWFIVKVADVNGGTTSADRRIHNGIDVVRTRFDGVAIDALIFATGDRTNPNATDVDNRLYMIRDEAVSAYTTAAPSAADCGDEDFEGDFRCVLPIGDAQLYDITSNALADEDDVTVVSALSTANGWRLDLENDGEKGLAKTITLGGKIFATTFTPNDLVTDLNVCEPLSGRGRLYIVNLFDGDRALLNLAPVVPDTPSVYFGDDGSVRLLLPPGTPPQPNDDDIDCSGGVCEIGQLFRQPYGNYWMEEEY